MQIFEGKSVFGGIAIGKIRVYQKNQQQVKRYKVEDTEQEVSRYQNAKEKAIQELQELYDKALREIGQANAAIFEVHQMMLEDDDYNDSVENMIRMEQINAEYAVAVTGDNFSEMFASMDDEYMKGRAVDVKDISERVLATLHGTSAVDLTEDEPVIIVSDDLAPSETVQMDKSKVLSFVTEHGSLNSHTAILARTMGIPALVGTNLPVLSSLDGKFAIVDGASGKFYVEPEEDVLQEMEKKRQTYVEQKELLETLKGKENVTLDGQKVKLYANIGDSKDLATVLQNDAEGIGLFRSEFIYLERDTFPTEEEQFLIYKQVVQTLAGKKVIIRTLDIGADKTCDYFEMDEEENPAMGCRAIRICLTRPEIFKVQLRALFRASAYGNLAIMYPMITSMEEVQRIKAIVEEVKRELSAEGIIYGDVEQGIMIETPAAVMMSDELANAVDFFSIGTNDLTQYALAIDRLNPSVAEYYTTCNMSILRLIEYTVKSAHSVGIPVCICGELAGNTQYTKEFIDIGVDELSVSPQFILSLRKHIRELE